MAIKTRLRTPVGGHRVLGWGRYTASHPVERRVIVRWERGHEEPLVLGTDLPWNWRKVVETFKRRMSIEELFRDEKNIRYGWGLRQMKIGNAARLERMFLVLAFAYLLLLVMGLICRDTMSEAHWASATTKSNDRACGFTIGRHMLTRVKWRLAPVLEALERMLTQWVEENWG
ncbi:MAG: transposase family protein [Planctomycetota bacterium]